jgi:hypothetical protein
MPLLGVRKPHGDMYSFLHRSASTIEGKRRLEEGVTDHMLRMSRPIELSVFRTTDQLSQPIFAFFFFFFFPLSWLIGQVSHFCRLTVFVLLLMPIREFSCCRIECS